MTPDPTNLTIRAGRTSRGHGRIINRITLLIPLNGDGEITAKSALTILNTLDAYADPGWRSTLSYAIAALHRLTTNPE